VNAPAYSKTKSSGIEWLGDVPEHWEVRRLKFSVKSNPVKSELTGISDDTEVSFVPMDAVGEYGGMNLEKEKLLNEVYTGYTYFLNGDVVIAKITPCFENGKGAIADGLKNGVGFGTTEFHVLRAEESCARRFLFYLTISHPFRKIGASEMLGAGGQKRVPEEFIKNLRLGIPPIFEQQAIAEFLDRKTGQIDELIGKKKELIKKLAEQRSALITHAVTKGLKASVPMKDSGTAWLGEVPKHWDVRRIKTIGTIRYGLGEPPAYQDEGLLFIRATDIFRGKIVLENMKRISSADVPWSRNPSVKAGEIIVVRSGAYTGDSAIVTKGLDGAIAGFDMVLTIQNGCSEFVAYALLSKYLLQGQIYLARMRAAQPHLNAEELGGFHFIAPPVKEQQAIAEYLDGKTGKIDGLIRKTETAIQTLEEYRTALITAAVTGKIDVRYTA
jgi:restriction endonuclease S subunit